MAQALPTRRWFQFGLRTMFVMMTTPAVFVAYHVNWIRQRHAIVYVTGRFEFRFISFDPAAEPHADVPGRPKGPGLLWLFGEHGYHKASLYFGQGVTPRELTSSEQAEVKRVKGLFPEADVRAAASETTVDVPVHTLE